MLYEVAVKTPLRRLFTYEFDRPIEKGVRVRVPFRSNLRTGVIWNESQKPAPKGLKQIQEILDEQPCFDQKTLLFLEKAAQYYCISLGEILTASLPDKIQTRGNVRLKHFAPALAQLSPAQASISESIMSSLGRFEPHLLMGEMGSGKTEIYLAAIEKILSEGGQVLYLVPEISLTPQLEERLSQRLGGEVSVFHSQVTPSKRRDIFSRVLSGEADIILGARSALFLPFTNLNLIVVDEEHDSSFKQGERGPYHARDLSLLRGQIFQVPVVLGSATPSLESYSRAQLKQVQLHRLSPYHGKKIQSFEVVDLKKVFEEEGRSFISQSLHNAIEDTLEKRQQVLLFLNRRGSASQRVCVQCGGHDECKFCSVTLTIHRDLKAAICHWCGFQKKLKDECDECQGTQFHYGGMGTKELESQIRIRFPEAQVARLDRDQAQKRNLLPEILKNYSSGKTDILIGTQMISKGIDIPSLSFVGVVYADQGWSVPDFRGTERSYQLLRQLMGRAGRRGQASRFMIQTFLPEHPIFSWLSQPENSYESFAEKELEIRKLADLPPYSRLALVSIAHKTEASAQAAALFLKDRISPMARALGITLIGPTAAPISKWKAYFRVQLLAKAALKGHMTSFLTAVSDDIDASKATALKGVKIKLDRDPYQFL